MADRLPLTAWAVATADTCLFVLVVVVLGHLSGGLPDALTGLNTLVGVAAFGYLWALVVVATRWGLGTGLPGDEGPTTARVALRAALAGSAVGVAFVLGAVLVASAPLVVAQPTRVGPVLLVGAIGSGVAAVVGAFVGLLAGLFDIAVHATARRLAGQTSATVT